MLQSLSIRNLVLFEDIVVSFGEGLNVVSGETGGGKSNLTMALAFLCGGRSRRDQVRRGAAEATVTGVFGRDGRTVVLERSVAATGSGRCTIDGESATLQRLREVGGSLVRLTSQHEQVSLTDPSVHLEILDSFGGCEGEKAEYGKSWAQCQSIASSLERTDIAEKDREYRQSWLRHQIEELRAARLQPGEDERIRRDLAVLRNAEKVRAGLAAALDALYEAEGSAVEMLGRASREMDKLASIITDLGGEMQSVASARAVVEDAARSLQARLEAAAMDPASLASMEERAFLIERLKKKHGPTIEDVSAALAGMEVELGDLDGLADRRRELEAALVEAGAEARKAAGRLHAARRRAARKLGKAVSGDLADLAFQSVDFTIEVEARAAGGGPLDGLDSTGGDEVRFMFRPNVGEDPAPLESIASGGELSRVFLALQAVMGAGDASATLVLDEADTGIGGRVADALGRKLREMGRRQQVVCVTHLPQIAVYADTHVLVEKVVEGGRTRSVAGVLGPADRRDEIARMLGGREVTARSREAAAEMIRLAAGRMEGTR